MSGACPPDKLKGNTPSWKEVAYLKNIAIRNVLREGVKR